MAAAGWSGSVLAVLAVLLSGFAWFDACRGEPDFREHFHKRFRKGLVLGGLLSVVGILIAYANAYVSGDASTPVGQFVATAALSATVATLGIALLNGLNPSPVNARVALVNRFIVLGWVFALPLLGYVSIYLPYRLIATLFPAGGPG